MTIEATIRAAHKEECGTIARLYSMASDGIANYIWSQLAEEGEDLIEVGTRRYAREGVNFSYQNCWMAELDGKVVGILSAFPMEADPDAAESPDMDPVLRPYARLEEDQSFYICCIAVDSHARGKGIGADLLAQAEDIARRGGFAKTSLIVFEGNEIARRLYETRGYRTVAREAIVPHPLIEISEGNALLMVKALERQPAESTRREEANNGRHELHC
jgi:ribosomal protein S18 acetylase RimI-like enzyme